MTLAARVLSLVPAKLLPAGLRAAPGKQGAYWRTFETAETPAYTDSWPTRASNINEDLARQLPTLRGRVRGIARNNEWAIGYLKQLTDNVLGIGGIRLQMRLANPDGTQNDFQNDLLESAFLQWGRDADVSGLTWPEIEYLALRSLAIDGEFIYRLRPGCGQYGMQLQILDPALLDVNLRRDMGKNRVRMGIELDENSRPVAYWLKAAAAENADIESYGQHVRIPAAFIRHVFVREEVGQLRGIPWLNGGARRLWLLRDFEESAAVASSNAAKRQGFFVSPTGDAPPGMAEGDKFMPTVPGQFDTLPASYQFQPFESHWPNVSASEFVKQTLRGWASALGMSYVTLGNDLESVNYSSARVGILSEREHYKVIQTQLIAMLHQPVMEALLPRFLLFNPSLSPALLEDYRAAITWQPRRWAGIDPVKEATANQMNIFNRITSPQRVILERGEDPDEIAAELDEWEKKYGPVQSAKPDKKLLKDKTHA